MATAVLELLEQLGARGEPSQAERRVDEAEDRAQVRSAGADQVQPIRLGHAYSVHNLSGTLGWALAPPFMVGLSSLWGFR